MLNMSDNLFLSKMTHKCTIATSHADKLGMTTDTTLFTNQPCFFEWQSQVIITEKGEKVAINGLLFLPDIVLDVDCRTYKITQTFPENRTFGNNYQIIPLHDPNTGILHHYEVWMR